MKTRLNNADKRGAHPVEWPTLAVAATIYAGWLVVTYWHNALPAPVLMIVGGWILAWHGSLQHETIHGHPTGIHAVNHAIGIVPLSIWLPYALYHRSHVAHHASSSITDPQFDPESRYVQYRRSAAWLVARLQSTLIGHMIFGPPVAVVRTLCQEISRGVAHPVQLARDWLPHLIAVALLVGWLDHAGISIGLYIMMFVYPGMVFTTLRAHAEHRADLSTASRAASVETAGPFALLFLNNNLHAAHHEQPGLSWYKLPAYHRQHRTRLAHDSVSLYNGYSQIVRRFAWRAHDVSLHPHYRGGNA
jgi:fatty acid desaturase